MAKRFAALARVSSREQRDEGFSLDVQEEALRRHAERHGGTVQPLFRIAETASKQDERKVFRTLIAHVREHAGELAGVLFYKVDRAARNIFDYVDLERLEHETGVPVIYVAQPTENNPAGRMQRRMLANMASFYTEQQSVDVKEGQERRVKAGLFVGLAPYGYRNVRVDKRGLVQVDPVEGPKVQLVFRLYAYENHTLDSLGQTLYERGAFYTEAVPRFPRSKLHQVLRDRSYIGEVAHRGQWFPGTHQPLVDRATFDRVQTLLGGKTYRSHELTYAGGLIHCGECEHPITGERVVKRTKDAEREHVYYRCTRYNAPGHARVRLREADLDAQVLGVFKKMKVQDEKVRKWIVGVLRAKALDRQKGSRERRAELERSLAQLQRQQDHLLNVSLAGEFEPQTVARKNQELKDAVAQVKLQLDVSDRGHDENADLAVRAFELSQALAEKWATADYAAKRQILQIVCLNLQLVGATLVPTMRKPFDVLAEGLVSAIGRGDRI